MSWVQQPEHNRVNLGGLPWDKLGQIRIFLISPLETRTDRDSREVGSGLPAPSVML
jgi:hypothetical protein